MPDRKFEPVSSSGELKADAEHNIVKEVLGCNICLMAYSMSSALEHYDLHEKGCWGAAASKCAAFMIKSILIKWL